jgi:hypothetical protein
MEGLWKTKKKKLSQDNQRPGRDSNLAPNEFTRKSGALPLEKICSGYFTQYIGLVHKFLRFLNASK